MSSKKDNIWLAGHYILTMLTSLLALKFNLMNFGAELFGVWVLLSSIWGLSNVLDLGFGMALIRAISRGKSKNSDLNVISSTGLVFFLIFGGNPYYFFFFSVFMCLNISICINRFSASSLLRYVPRFLPVRSFTVHPLFVRTIIYASEDIILSRR